MGRCHKINYLLSHFKGRYRILCEYDKRTNQFPRKINGTFEDIDCYITCQKGGRIHYFGNRMLEYYCPSLGRGHNIIKAINHAFQEENIIYNIVETDTEVLFRFNATDIEKLESYLQPKTNGADRSPFSTKNLPKSKYIIPDEDFAMYKNIIENIPKNQLISIVHSTKDFLKSMATKKHTYEDIKADMVLKGLKGKEYIHSIGEWNEYIKYLQEHST